MLALAVAPVCSLSVVPAASLPVVGDSSDMVVAAKLAKLKMGEIGNGRIVGVQICTPTIDQAAEMLSVGRRSVARAKHVLEHGSKEIIEAVEQGQLPVSFTAKMVTKEPDKRTQTQLFKSGGKAAKEARDKRIFDMWLACYTQQEIADATGWSQPTVKSFIENGSVADLDKTDQLSAEHATDFTPPIYNIWKQQEKSNGSSHFGNSEVRWLDNLLYLYTKPFDMVLDPFAGGGSTIDICKKRFRRNMFSDHKPIVE